MLTSIHGTFRNGRVELEEDPGITGEAAVVVTFLEPQLPRVHTDTSKMIRFGMLAEPGRRVSSEEDFKVAEYLDNSWDDEVAK
jgi:hypothetical protein